MFQKMGLPMAGLRLEPNRVSVKMLHWNAAAKQSAVRMKPFSSTPEKLPKPASAKVEYRRTYNGVDHVDADFDVVSRLLPGTPA
jgi:hypothetical protein